MGNGIRISDLETAFLEVVAVIQERSAYEKRTFRIDHHTDIGRLHHDVAIRRTVHEIPFVLQAGAASADHGHAERPCSPALFFQERIEFTRGVLGHFDQPLIANLVIDGGWWR